MNDTDTMQKCNVMNGSIVYLIPHEQDWSVTESGCVLVMNLQGIMVPVYVTKDTKVESVKKKIHGVHGIPEDQQRLIFNGK